MSEIEGQIPSDEVIKLVLHLLAVRAAVRVGVMLNERFPTEDEMMEFCNNQDTVEGLEAFAEARRSVELLALQGNMTQEAVSRAIEQHHPRAMEAIEVLAEQIMVNPSDLFSFLLRA